MSAICPRASSASTSRRTSNRLIKSSPDKKKTVAELKKLAKKSDTVILASDPDREGEAISWHLSQLIEKDNPKIFRVTFNEITEEGIKKAFEHLGRLDQPKIDAQQTRRLLEPGWSVISSVRSSGKKSAGG